MNGRERIKSEAGAVHACLDRIDAALVGIGHDLQRLDPKAALLSTRWTGDAQEAYEAAHRETMREYEELLRIARQLASISRRTTDDLARADQELAQMWR